MSHPALTWHPGNLNGSRCNSSSTEVGVLAAITGRSPIPPAGGTYCHWRRGFNAPINAITYKSEIPLTYLIHVLVVPPGSSIISFMLKI
ncbi:hypothetical protein AVEN_66077-1 [Araneus ventricosus]|uniref:Uncharacterized protein n=1 Tax=Araneus ventricosus TaxID=182803 RepID=A0A4Y1ZMG9_ARAVE|nr:hypothetical protein AVEN_232117-1 [Araneus ventricosus]GBL58673.1 hypothetical protein AVEN_66077-1 [Araneus ventricosus]